MISEDFVRKFINYEKDNYSTLRSSIPGYYLPEVYKGDELGIAIRSMHAMYLFLIADTTSPDRRNPDNLIKFTAMSMPCLNSFLIRPLLEYGITMNRRSDIDNIDELKKLVAVVFVRHGDHVLLVPRTGKAILSNMLTLSVMESITIDDFRKIFPLDCHLYREPDSLLEQENQIEYMTYEADWSRLLVRGVREECPYLFGKLFQFTGIVYGGKDLGIVFGVEVDKDTFSRIRRMTCGVSFDPKKFPYGDVVRYYGGRLDGWSEAIIKFVQQYAI